MSYLDKFNDNDFDIEDKLAYLEEANNFYSEASRQEALRLAQQGAAIYDKASTTNKDAKKFKRSDAYASRIAEKNNRFYDLDQADAELQDNKTIYGKYDKKRAKAMSLEVSKKLAPLEDEINSQKQYIEDLMSQAYDNLAASGKFNILTINNNLKHLRKGSLEKVDRRMVGFLGSGFMDLVAKTQKHLISLDEQRKDIIKKANYVKSKEGYTANANKIIQDSAKAKEKAMKRFKQIEHVDQVNADAKTPDKMKVKNGQTLSEYQKRSIKKAYAANELDQEKKDRKELEKSARAGGFKQNKIYADDTKGRLMQKYAAGRLGVNKDGSRKPLQKIQEQPTQQQAQPTNESVGIKFINHLK